MNAPASANWANRLGPTARIITIIVAFTFGMFAVGMVAGFSYAVIAEGRLPTKPIAYLSFAAMIGLVALIGWVLLSLFRSIDPDGMSRFDRRYWKMWAVMAGLSIPLLIGIAMLGLNEDASLDAIVLSNRPIAPLTAILGAILLSAVLIVSAVIYLRAIDDHEARAYLWGSTVAYHFIALAFPLHWLLARGGLIPPLTIGFALLLVLTSLILQAIVWAVFKFR